MYPRIGLLTLLVATGAACSKDTEPSPSSERDTTTRSSSSSSGGNYLTSTSDSKPGNGTGGAAAGGAANTSASVPTGGATHAVSLTPTGGTASNSAPTGGATHAVSSAQTGGTTANLASSSYLGGTTATSPNSTHSGGTTAPSSSTSVTLRLPDANASFDYQIGGAYTPPSGVTIVSRDRKSPPAAGLYNICYVNGFQSQPDEESFWKDQHPELLLRDSSNAFVIDEDWGEYLLDTSTAEKRQALGTIVGEWIQQCARDGFDAIEVDNLDSYSRSSGLLTQAQNISMMRILSDVAHAQGLAVAQKNSTELLAHVNEMGTDFAVAEECNRWGECADYQGAYGNRVYVIEYRASDFNQGCTSYPELSIVLRDLDVSTPSSSSYVFDGC